MSDEKTYAQDDVGRLPTAQDYLRYAQITSVSGSIASCKYLVWTGSAFGVYGAEFPIYGTYVSGDVGKNIWITWRRDLLTWIAVTSNTTPGTFTLIEGNVYSGPIAPTTGSFYINHVILLAGSNDPRTVAGSLTELVPIVNAQREGFEDGELITAIWNGAAWIVLPVERPRVIKGDYYTTTDSTHIMIQNVVALASGLLPTLGEGDSIIVRKESGATYSSGDIVRCDYNVLTSEFEARPKGSASEKYRLIKGKPATTAGFGSTSFTLGTITVLAGGLTPAPTVTVQKLASECFLPADDVVAIWIESASQWEVLRVERFRAIRGTYVDTPSSTTVRINTVNALDSGLDPRSDPTDAGEIVILQKLASYTYTTGDVIAADYNINFGWWEARPKTTTTPGGKGYTVAIDGTISPGSAATPTSGTGEVFEVAPGGTTTSLGAGKTIWNPWNWAACSSATVVAIGSDEYLLTGPPIFKETKTFVTGVTCDETDGLTYGTDDITFARDACGSE